MFTTSVIECLNHSHALAKMVKINNGTLSSSSPSSTSSPTPPRSMSTASTANGNSKKQPDPFAAVDDLLMPSTVMTKRTSDSGAAVGSTASEGNTIATSYARKLPHFSCVDTPEFARNLHAVVRLVMKSNVCLEELKLRDTVVRVSRILLTS